MYIFTKHLTVQQLKHNETKQRERVIFPRGFVCPGWNKNKDKEVWKTRKWVGWRHSGKSRQYRLGFSSASFTQSLQEKQVRHIYVWEDPKKDKMTWMKGTYRGNKSSTNLHQMFTLGPGRSMYKKNQQAKVMISFPPLCVYSVYPQCAWKACVMNVYGSLLCWATNLSLRQIQTELVCDIFPLSLTIT